MKSLSTLVTKFPPSISVDNAYRSRGRVIIDPRLAKADLVVSPTYPDLEKEVVRILYRRCVQGGWIDKQKDDGWVKRLKRKRDGREASSILFLSFLLVRISYIIHDETHSCTTSFV